MSNQDGKARFLNLQGLEFKVAGRAVLRSLTARLPLSGTTAVIGPNGAGKTTLLKLIHRILPPTAGRWEWGGYPAPPRTGLLLQNPVLLRRSVRSNIRFALDMTCRPANRDREDHLLRQGGLTDLANRPARQLSGGERQRLALVRELALAPDILLLDEPAAGLDPATTAKLEGLITDLAAGGCSVLLTSHDMAQVKRLADRIVFIDQGEILAQGDQRSLFKNPPSPQLAAFLKGELFW